MQNTTYYHGTSTALPIAERILPPSRTGNLREHWRNKDRNKVFFTVSLLSARKFAKKACEAYGGEPVIYIVKPAGQVFGTVNGEYIADSAIIVGKERVS